MRNTVAKGSAAEVFVAKELQSKGFVVASRRHIGGAGDLLAVHPDGRIWLTEVKARRSVYQGFRKADRQAMREVADKFFPGRVELWLANKQGKEIVWTPSNEWPNSK